jgi:hypothetical protein
MQHDLTVVCFDNTKRPRIVGNGVNVVVLFSNSSNMWAALVPNVRAPLLPLPRAPQPAPAPSNDNNNIVNTINPCVRLDVTTKQFVAAQKEQGHWQDPSAIPRQELIDLFLNTARENWFDNLFVAKLLFVSRCCKLFAVFQCCSGLSRRKCAR